MPARRQVFLLSFYFGVVIYRKICYNIIYKEGKRVMDEYTGAAGGADVREEDGDKKRAKKKKINKYASNTLKILCAAIYAAATILSLSMFFSYAGEEEAVGRAILIFVFLVVQAGIVGAATIAVVVIAIVGLIHAVKSYKSGYTGKGGIIYFAVFTVLPIATWFAITFSYNLL